MCKQNVRLLAVGVVIAERIGDSGNFKAVTNTMADHQFGMDVRSMPHCRSRVAQLKREYQGARTVCLIACKKDSTRGDVRKLPNSHVKWFRWL